MIIYVAGKYNAPTTGEKLFNVHKAMDVGIRLYEESEHKIYPSVPHLTHWVEERMDYLGYPSRENSYWYQFDNLIIPKCDGLLKISKDGESKGADAEQALAEKLGIPVYRTVEEVLDVSRKTD